MRLWLRTAPLAIALLAVSTAAIAIDTAPAGDSTVHPATVEQPRAFGYTLGDVLTQRVLLEAQGGTFQPAGLPRPERLGVWLERRAPRIESSPDGRKWLVADYQIINAPEALTVVTLPAWTLPAKFGNALKVGEWPISIAPLTPRTAFDKGALVALRPDRAAPFVATAPKRYRLLLWSGACALTLAAWLVWLLWRNWRAAWGQPFARALREMRDDDDAAAWQALHRAFDRTAGRVTQTATLPALFATAPQLAPLHEEIELFFAQSGDRFFGGGLPANAVSVRALCGELRRIEKRQER